MVMCFTYAEEPLFRGMFPDTETVVQGRKILRIDFVFRLVTSLKH